MDTNQLIMRWLDLNIEEQPLPTLRESPSPTKIDTAPIWKHSLAPCDLIGLTSVRAMGQVR
jgi:hypothetical protein